MLQEDSGDHSRNTFQTAVTSDFTSSARLTTQTTNLARESFSCTSLVFEEENNSEW